MTGSAKRYLAVVEDDENVSRAFARLLRSAGFEPITYLSAEAFLGDDKRPRFDCLVADFQLPGISGLELARRLASVSDPTPVLLLTARDDPSDRAAAQSAGCAGYFQKTDPGSDILDGIHNALHTSAGITALPERNSYTPPRC
jgi:FixJ family two-component response regulator